MNICDPILQIKGPDGEFETIHLSPLLSNSKTCITAGREGDNDVVLPSPYLTVSKHHFDIEYRDERWWLIDRSSNGTFVRRGDELTPIDVAQQDHHALLLENNDEILILGKLIQPDDYVFWHLTFRSNDSLVLEDRQALLHLTFRTFNCHIQHLASIIAPRRLG